MDNLITLAETEGIALLQRLVDLKAVRSIEPLPDLDNEALIKRFGASPPAIYVAAGDWKMREARTLEQDINAAVVVRFARGAQAAKDGDRFTVGLGALAAVVASLWHECVTEHCTWSVKGVETVQDAAFDRNGLAVANVSATVLMELPFHASEVELEDFLRLHVDLDIDGVGGLQDDPRIAAAAAYADWFAITPDYTRALPHAQADIDIP